MGGARVGAVDGRPPVPSSSEEEPHQAADASCNQRRSGYLGEGSSASGYLGEGSSARPRSRRSRLLRAPGARPRSHLSAQSQKPEASRDLLSADLVRHSGCTRSARSRARLSRLLRSPGARPLSALSGRSQASPSLSLGGKHQCPSLMRGSRHHRYPPLAQPPRRGHLGSGLLDLPLAPRSLSGAHHRRSRSPISARSLGGISAHAHSPGTGARPWGGEARPRMNARGGRHSCPPSRTPGKNPTSQLLACLTRLTRLAHLVHLAHLAHLTHLTHLRHLAHLAQLAHLTHLVGSVRAGPPRAPREHARTQHAARTTHTRSRHLCAGAVQLPPHHPPPLGASCAPSEGVGRDGGTSLQWGARSPVQPRAKSRTASQRQSHVSQRKVSPSREQRAPAPHRGLRHLHTCSRRPDRSRDRRHSAVGSHRRSVRAVHTRGREWRKCRECGK